MLQRFIDNAKNKGETKQTGIVTPKKPLTTSFGGVNHQDMIKYIKNGGGGASIGVAKIELEARKSLESFGQNDNKDQPAILAGNLLETIAILYATNELHAASEKLRSHINNNRGQVEKSYWYMLFDLYEASGATKDFEKAAQSYATMFGISPPSMSTKTNTDQYGAGGKNILILSENASPINNITFADFLKAAKKEQFCRININQCDFQKITPEALAKLLKLFVNLKKAKIRTILMGDDKLISKCKEITQDATSNPDNNTWWLIYFEILQLKGQKAEFEALNHEYNMKYHLSAPGWDDGAVVLKTQQDDEDIRKASQDDEDARKASLNRGINNDNIDDLLTAITNSIVNDTPLTIDLTLTKSISYSHATKIAHTVQEALKIAGVEKTQSFNFRGANEFIFILFKMLGLDEYIIISPKHIRL